MSEQNVVDVPSRSASDDFEPDFDGGEYEGGSGDSGDSEGADGGQGQPAPGMGQSKSSRRRRRKRKKLTTVTAGSGEASGSDENGSAPAYAPLVMEGETIALAQGDSGSSNGSAPSPQAQTAPRERQERQHGGQNQGGGQNQNAQNQNGQNQNGQAQGQGKRWKKKFRDRERTGRGAGGDGPREDRGHSNPGNNQGGGGGSFHERPHRREGGGRPDNFGNLVSTQARKQKPQGRERSGFVGPMDHSYRDGNPEYGDLSPSTISTRGRRTGHRGDNQPIDHNSPRPKPVPEDAQTHIYLFIEDLFVTAKVNEAARKLGIKVGFVKNDKDAVAELTSGEELNKPTLIVFDLNNAGAKPLTLIPKLKAKLKRSCSIIGFLSHLQGDLKAKATEAGCDVVMPRSAFSQSLPNLLRRYGIEEEEEINFNY